VGATLSGATIHSEGELTGRGALVTGAGGGIGAGIARVLASAGAHVVVNDINQATADAIAAEIIEAGGSAQSVPADVADEAAIGTLFAAAGAVDILVNNVGVSLDPAPLQGLPVDQLDRLCAINLRSAVSCCQHALPGMTERGWGRIVNISSRTWLGAAGLSFYSATKGGLVSFTRSLALEVGRAGVTVNAIAPGTIHSPAFDAMSPERIDALLDRNPAGRFGYPADVGRAVRFLVAPASAAITGHVLHVCGGRSLYGGPSIGLSLPLNGSGE
jgi:NAD(P)-dependent dehydrogenase (short-subunit alcohol dehydrogenase family)